MNEKEKTTDAGGEAVSHGKQRAVDDPQYSMLSHEFQYSQFGPPITVAQVNYLARLKRDVGAKWFRRMWRHLELPEPADVTRLSKFQAGLLIRRLMAVRRKMRERR